MAATDAGFTITIVGIKPLPAWALRAVALGAGD
jgi:hypothetical protein